MTDKQKKSEMIIPYLGDNKRKRNMNDRLLTKSILFGKKEVV